MIPFWGVPTLHFVAYFRHSRRSDFDFHELETVPVDVAFHVVDYPSATDLDPMTHVTVRLDAVAGRFDLYRFPYQYVVLFYGTCPGSADRPRLSRRN